MVGQAYKELGLLFILVAVAILTFSSLVYFAEKVFQQIMRMNDWNDKVNISINDDRALIVSESWASLEQF